MKDILDEIIARKREEIARQKQAVSIELLRENATQKMQEQRSMRAALTASPYGIIAEFKRKSPSKGWIKELGRADEIPSSYEANGATALSILTDAPFFGGSLHDIAVARPLTGLPVLRKDFIIDEYQLFQARIVGADTVLLIAAALSPEECRKLAEEAHRLCLEVLLEIHRESELDCVNEHIDMIGVNNRNLGSFHTDVKNSFRLAEKLPADFLKVSESGISDPATIKELRQAGFRGFLIGETFMKTENPGATLRQFINDLSCS